ncbi:SRPBCC family protein [Amycolatopsis ultiminotia]|uniref:SRPBCC family protein n=1 Tax=Amycolatopsis ultiminotia TaxID=543629 RepID=A0ABP6XM82_9PSEU
MPTPSTPADDSPQAAHPALDVRHDTFVITRNLDAPRREVFTAFADNQIRQRWHRLPGSGVSYRHEFRVDSGEHARSTFTMPDSDPEQLAYRSRYLDIVENRRIVFTYASSVDDILRWTSLVTVLLADGEEDGSTLTWTEQAVFLTRTGDGSADLPHLRGATGLRLNGLAATLESGRRSGHRLPPASPPLLGEEGEHP